MEGAVPMIVANALKSNVVIKTQGRYTNEAPPSVSVLLPISITDLNQIKKCIETVLNQDYDSIQLVIADNTDNGDVQQLLADAAAQDNRICLLSIVMPLQNNAILYYIAYLYSCGWYIVFLSIEVCWNADFIRLIRRHMVTQEMDAAFGRIIFPFENEVGLKCRIYYGGGSNVQNLNSVNILSEGSVMVSRKVIEDVGFLSPHRVIQTEMFREFYVRLKKRFPLSCSGTRAGLGIPPDDSCRPFAGDKSAISKWIVNEYLSLSAGESCKLQEYENLDTESLPDGMQATPITAKRRILTLVPIVLASVTLYEERLNLPHDQYDMRILMIDHATDEDLLLADMVIIVRDPFNMDEWAQKAKRLGIPVYFFMDDNFSVLRKENPKSLLFRPYTLKNLRKKLKDYKALFLSTQPLLDYHREHALHDNLILFPPINGEWTHEKRSGSAENSITISYMGGLSRIDSVYNYLLPALKRLSEEIPVRFVCPSFVDGSKYESDVMEIIYVPFSESLDHIIMLFARYHIDIQLHSAVETENNIYKTINALMNSTQVGAALITSDTEPYNSVPNHESLFLLCDNTIEGWYETIAKLAKDKQLRQTLLQNASLYCKKEFSGDGIRSSFIEELNHIPVLDEVAYDLRKTALKQLTPHHKRLTLD